MIEYSDSDYATVYGILETQSPDKHPMWYGLHLYGVWCKGKHGRCYKGDANACVKCEFYDGRGSNQ